MIEYSFDKKFECGQLEALFSSVDWESADFPKRLHQGVTNSETVISAWDGDSLVGIMTAVSDSSMNVFFPYLAVSPKYQGMSIGMSLVSKMLEKYSETYRKILICNKDICGFYQKCGFIQKNEETPMMIIGFDKI